jgi:hypothetical protein
MDHHKKTVHFNALKREKRGAGKEANFAVMVSDRKISYFRFRL